MTQVLGPQVRVVLIVYALSCLLHAAVLLMVVDDLQACCLAPDSAGYITLAHEGLFDFVRNPGYPAFLRLVERFADQPLIAALWAQVFVVSLTPAQVAWFATIALPRFRGAAYVAGILSAVSFTGITLGHFILADVLLAPIVMAAIIALYAGARAGRPGLLIVSAILGGMAFLIRPIFLFWGVVAPVLTILFASATRPAAWALALVTVIGLAFPLSWSVLNRSLYGVFAPSSNGVSSACVYLAARVSAIVATPRGPSQAQIVEIQQKLLAEAETHGTEAERYRYYSQCAARSIAHPQALWWAFRANARESLPAPLDPQALRWNPGAALASRLTARLLTGLNQILYFAAFIGALRLIAVREGRLLAGLLLMFAVMWALSAMTFWQGSRLMYPVEPILLLLAVVGCTRRMPVARARVEPLAARSAQGVGEPKVSVVIAVANQATAIGTLLESIRRGDRVAERELILVDDCSNDGTDRVIADAASRDTRIHAYRLVEPRGLDAALASGVARSHGRVVVTHRVDLADDASDHDRLAAPILEGAADAVYGTRFDAMPRRVGPLWPRAYAWLLSSIFNLLNNRTFSDIASGQKAFRGDLIRAIDLDSVDNFDVRVTAAIARQGQRVIEWPIRYRWHTQSPRRASLADALDTIFGIVGARFERRLRPEAAESRPAA